MMLLRSCAPAQLAICTALLLLSAGCDSGGGARVEAGGLATASAGSDAISLTSQNARAAVTLTVSETITSSTPFFDAVTGQMTTTATATQPDRHFDLRSGSTSDGAFALDLTATGAATGLLDDLGSVSVRRGILVASDRDGQVIPGTQMGLHVALGTSSTDPLSVMGGLVADQLPVTGEQAARGTAQAGITNVATSGALTTITMQTTDSGPGVSPTMQRRVYEYRNRKYVLREMSVDVTDNTSGEQVSRQMTLQFSSVAWSNGLKMEAMSSAASMASTSAWGGGANTNLTPPPCNASEDPNCLQGGEPSLPDPHPQCTVPPLDPSGANIVYVHGISATGGAWGSPATNNAVRGKTRCNLYIARDLAPSLTLGGLKGYGHHAQQATQLGDTVRASGLQDVIFVGHSQGGLISRRVAQSFQGTASSPSVRGVVTTGTPHMGANIANNLSTLGIPGRVARIFSGGFACRITNQCSLIAQSMNALQDQLPDAALASNAMRDLRPSSAAIQQVNTPPESYRRFGIQNALPQPGFLLYQVAGDAMEGNRGREIYGKAKAAAVVAFSVAVIGGVVSIFAPWAAIVASVASVVFAAIVGADLAWSRLTFGSQQSDGVVELSSQYYPNSPGTNAPVNRRSLDPSSHTAQIDSERSAEDIQRTLAGNELRVARR